MIKKLVRKLIINSLGYEPKDCIPKPIKTWVTYTDFGDGKSPMKGSFEGEYPPISIQVPMVQARQYFIEDLPEPCKFWTAWKRAMDEDRRVVIYGMPRYEK